MAPGVVLLSAIATITNLWTTLLVARGPKKKLLQILRCMTVSQITDEGNPFPSRVQNMHVSFGGGVWSVLTEHFLAKSASSRDCGLRLVGYRFRRVLGGALRAGRVLMTALSVGSSETEVDSRRVSWTHSSATSRRYSVRWPY